MERVFVVGMAVLAAASAIVTIVMADSRRVEDQVLLWESRVGLPRDEAARADAVRRLMRRTSISSLYALLGLLAGTVALIGDLTVVGLAGYFACGLVGYSLGVWRVHIDDLRERSDRAGTRAAVLHHRRLLDFLTPAEVVAPWILLTVAALSFFLGLDALATDRFQATILIAAALLQLVVFAVAQVLRELAQPAIFGPFILGDCIYLGSALDRLDGLAVIGTMLAMPPVMWVVFSIAGKKAWRRSQRQFQPELVE